MEKRTTGIPSDLLKVGPDGSFKDRFFVLTHKEICAAQDARNKPYAEKYFQRHQRQPDLSMGVDNVTVELVEQYEDQWSKIVDRFADRATQTSS